MFGGILTADQKPAVMGAGGYRKWLEKLTVQRWGRKARVDWNMTGEPVRAWILRSQWVADCPTPRCRGNVPVCFEEPFWCPDCGNAVNNNKASPIEFPEGRHEIAVVLLYRADPNTRNWILDRGDGLPETIDDLKQQNIEHGEGIPQ